MAQASLEKFEHTVPAELERIASVPQSEQLTTTPKPPLLKEKGRAISPHCEITNRERIKVGKSERMKLRE